MYTYIDMIMYMIRLYIYDYLIIYIYILYYAKTWFLFLWLQGIQCLPPVPSICAECFILDWKKTYNIVRSMAQGSRIASFWTISTTLTCSPDYLLIIYIYGALKCSS